MLGSGDDFLDSDLLSLIQRNDPVRYESVLYRLSERAECSIYILNRMAKAGDSRCADGILGVLERGSKWDAFIAALAAASLGLRSAAPLLVERIRRGESELIRRLGAVGTPDHIGFIREHLDPASPVLADAIDALVELGDPGLERDLDAFVNHSSDEARLAVLRAVERLGVTRLAPVLRLWTRDTCRELRMGAAAALVKWRDPEAAACALRVGASPYHRRSLFAALNGIVPPDTTLNVVGPDMIEGRASIRASDLPDLVSRTRFGYVIDGDTIRFVPWERAVEEIVARR